jgi:hypothetical protein
MSPQAKTPGMGWPLRVGKTLPWVRMYPNIEAFIALAQQRAQSLSYGSLTSYTDEPDVAALAARLALPSR